MRKEKKSNVYVIASSDGPLKIGHAECPHSRLERLRTASPYHLEVIYYIECPKRLVWDIEQMAHKKLSSCRMNGEWFDCSIHEARAAIESSAKHYNVEIKDLPEWDKDTVIRFSVEKADYLQWRGRQAKKKNYEKQKILIEAEKMILEGNKTFEEIANFFGVAPNYFYRSGVSVKSVKRKYGLL